MRNTATLQKHREVDGIAPEEFELILDQSYSRADLMCRHVQLMTQARVLTRYRWFDKTPQNIYGLPLIAAEFPAARFLHLIRNPLNVIASLKLGKVMKVTDIHGACNYWLEAVTIIRQMTPLLGGRLLEMRYEDITRDPASHMRELLAFSDLGDRMNAYSSTGVHPERDQYLTILTADEQALVRQRCSKFAAYYDYNL